MDNERSLDNQAQDSAQAGPGAPSGITFDHGGTKYTVSVDVAMSSGLSGHADRIQLPGGTLIMLHPHVHEDNANTAQSIAEKGGKIWQVE